MRKLVLVLLSLFILFSFCKKNSSSNEESKDEITVNIYVEKGGSALFNAYVEMTCTINEPVSDTYNLGNTRSNPMSDTQTIQTGHDGIASYRYTGKSLVGDNGIYLTVVKIRHSTYGVLSEIEDLEILISRNTSHTYEVILP